MTYLATAFEYVAYVLGAIMLLAVGTLAYLVWPAIRWARASGLDSLQTEKHAAARQTIVAHAGVAAAIIGGLWLVFSVGVSGSLEAQRLALDVARAKDRPIPNVSLSVEQFSQSADGTADTWAVQFLVTLTNKGPKEAELEYDKMPLLVLSRVEPQGVRPIATLAYRKVVCPAADHTTCSVTTWKRGWLSPEGTGTIAFVHPGLPRGIYHAQFQIPVPVGAVYRKSTDAEGPELWPDKLYFEVTPKKP